MHRGAAHLDAARGHGAVRGQHGGGVATSKAERGHARRASYLILLTAGCPLPAPQTGLAADPAFAVPFDRGEARLAPG